MTDEVKYNVNFFRPLSAHAKANTKLIVVLASIWAVGVFGFQFLLMALNEPTPEPAYATFERVWPAIESDAQADIPTHQEFSRCVLYVLGKNIAVKDADKAILKTALSWSVMTSLSQNVYGQSFDASKAGIELATTAIGLGDGEFDEIMIDLLPTSMVEVEGGALPADVKEALPGIMELYLVHNRSALTDTPFLGFPFHYWYTAQFLLILFVLLCLIYALITDRMNIKHEFVEAT